MHDYAVFDHDRATVGRWLGFIAILFAGGLTSLTTYLQGVTGWETFGATVATGAIYAFLQWGFNTWGWKYAWKFGLLSIPDLNGVWEVEGKSLGEDGKLKVLLDENNENVFEWKSELDIEQNWQRIAILSETQKSDSQSYTTTMYRKPGTKGGWVVSYSYRNVPKQQERGELNDHKGFCEIEFSQDLHTGKATYFNSQGRRTYGDMLLKRKSS